MTTTQTINQGTVDLVAQERGMHHLQPDYILAREGDMRRVKGVGCWWPRFHDSDHQAVVATIRAGKRGEVRLKAYQRKQQEIPIQLPPQELQDDLTIAFVALQATCKDPEVAKRHWRDWVSNKT